MYDKYSIVVIWKIPKINSISKLVCDVHTLGIN